jgi:hypothetical protein
MKGSLGYLSAIEYRESLGFLGANVAKVLRAVALVPPTGAG